MTSTAPLPRAHPPAASGTIMKRFHDERAIMIKRWRQEWLNHGRNFGNCHCGLGYGTMRKHRPNESHPSRSCSFCRLDRLWAKQARRRKRYAARKVITEGLAL